MMNEQEQKNKEPQAQAKTTEQAAPQTNAKSEMPKAPSVADIATLPKKVMIDDTHKYTTVTAEAYIGPGNAHHRYIINDKKAQVFAILNFQDGAIKESGVNGIMDENLLAILIDRLTGFQSGKYACDENAVALSKLKSALVMLKARTIRREKEGKEGTHQK